MSEWFCPASSRTGARGSSNHRRHRTSLPRRRCAVTFGNNGGEYSSQCFQVLASLVFSIALLSYSPLPREDHMKGYIKYLIVGGIVILVGAIWLTSRQIQKDDHPSTVESGILKKDSQSNAAKTSNTPQEAVMAFTREQQFRDYRFQNLEILQLRTSGESGYAVLSDGKPPKTKIGFAILGIMRLNDDPSWGIPEFVLYDIEGNKLKENNKYQYYPIHALVPVDEIMKRWIPEWENDLRVLDISITQQAN